MANRKLKIIYRSNSHAPLWLVADKSGSWQKNGLDVDTSPQLIREKAVESLKNGHVDLISGNHHNLYVRNAKNGEDFVHLAQAANNWTENKLVVRPGIGSKEHAAPILKLQTDEEVETLYEEWAQSLETKPFVPARNLECLPARAATQPRDRKLQPAQLVRELDDSGYIDRLYQ
jgi:hypothetical protein